MLNERLVPSFRHAMYSVRGGFLVGPHILALALGCAGALLGRQAAVVRQQENRAGLVARRRSACPR